MTNHLTSLGFKRTACACPSCSVFCRFIPGFLIPEDLERMSRSLGYTSLEKFARENLLASPGAVGIRDGRRIEIRTLVLQRRPSSTACKFLDDHGLCRIHRYAPYGCSHFEEHM